jgi:uncharacterized delta-60 repeat protein
MRIKHLPALLICLFFLSLTVFSQKLLFDNSFTPTINGSVNFVETLNDGKILIAGVFTSVNGVSRNKIARLNSDGSLDASFDANSTIVLADNPVIYSMEILPDGKILLGGDLGSEQPTGYRKAVLRLNADGTLDSTLTSFPRVLGGTEFVPRLVKKAEQLPNGKILICGSFLEANGNQKIKLARYNFDGSYDSTFTTTIFDNSFNTDCRDVEAQPDGKYFVSGAYTAVNGVPRVGLTRFNTDDSIDTNFNPTPVPGAPTSYYSGLELLSDGRMIVSQTPGNGAVRRGAQFSNNGSLINLYDENETNTSGNALNDVSNAAFQTNGKAYIVDGARDNLFRYYPDGTRDGSQNRLSFFGGSDSGLKAVAVLPDGKVLVGGNFNSFVPDLGTDNTQINQQFLVRFIPQTIPIKPKYDFDGDGKDDLAVFRPSDRVWYLNRSTAGFYSTQFGLSTDKPVAADYDGDGKTDIAVFRDGVWYWLRSSDSVFAYTVMGQAGDIPLPGGFYLNSTINGVITFRPSDAKFYVQQPYANPVQVSMRQFTMLPTDKPLLADFNGDGKNDLCVFRNGNWYIDDATSTNTRHYQFGLAGDIPLIGDFDGDGKTDYAVFRPSDGTWYIQKSTEGFYSVRWGLSDDLPVPADYDGDGKTDIAVYRNGIWYELLSTNSYRTEQFGLSNDVPAQLR